MDADLHEIDEWIKTLNTARHVAEVVLDRARARGVMLRRGERSKEILLEEIAAAILRERADLCKTINT